MTTRQRYVRFTCTEAVFLTIALGATVCMPWRVEAEDAKEPRKLVMKKPAPTGGKPDLLGAPFGESRAREAQEAWARQLGTKVEETNSIGMKLRLIPAGEFQMGSSAAPEVNVRPEHKVLITKPLYVSIYEVTQQEFERVMERNTSWFSRTGGGSEKVSGQNTGRFPVEDVSWYDCVEFCNKLSEKEGVKPYYHLTEIKRDDDQSIKKADVSLNGGKGYRLPTEAEWEYACRAGTTTAYHFGDQNNGREANVDGTSPDGTEEKGPFLERTTTVGSYRPNNFGLYDMHGNVYEWCQDWFSPDYYKYSPLSDPTGPESGTHRLLRGGSWFNSAEDTHCFFRNWYTPYTPIDYLGFRVARTP